MLTIPPPLPPLPPTAKASLSPFARRQGSGRTVHLVVHPRLLLRIRMAKVLRS